LIRNWIIGARLISKRQWLPTIASLNYPLIMSEPYQSATGQDAIASPTVPSFPQAPPIPEHFGYGDGQFAGQPLPAGTHLDQRSGLVLPDGVELASTGRRVGAYFLAIPLAIITLGIGYVVWGLIIWRKGQTPALQVLGMRCWRPETQRVPGFWWMALREVVGRLADGIVGPITEITSFVLMMTSQDRKSLHDMIAGTVVVHDPNKVLSS
jgi:uncharacterized RDD family membrane protein YckC